MCEIGGSVLLETNKGDVVIDLYTKDCPKTCENFLKLCKVKYYNDCPFHRIEKDFVAQCGDKDRRGGCSVWGLLDGDRFFDDELKPQRRRKNKLRHERRGVVTMANAGKPNTNGSQFMIQLGDRHIEYLDERHTIFGEVAEGFEVLEKMNEAVVNEDNKPLSRFAIQHVHVLDDPFPDPPGLGGILPDRSPSLRIESDDEYVSSGDEGDDEDVDHEKIEALREARAAKSRELTLQATGDIADADLEPPKNVLFVCCLNPVTEDEGLEIAFSRFGKITSCEIMRTKDGKSLQYAFIEFESVKACERAYLKMEDVRIDDRRIHVDLSQSVPRVWNKWMSGDEKPQDKDRSKDPRDARDAAPATEERRRDRQERDERDEPSQRRGRDERDRDQDRERRRDDREEPRTSTRDHDGERERDRSDRRRRDDREDRDRDRHERDGDRRREREGDRDRRRRDDRDADNRDERERSGKDRRDRDRDRDHDRSRDRDSDRRRRDEKERDRDRKDRDSDRRRDSERDCDRRRRDDRSRDRDRRDRRSER